MHAQKHLPYLLSLLLLPAVLQAHDGGASPRENRIGFYLGLQYADIDAEAAGETVHGFRRGSVAPPVDNGFALADAGFWLQWGDEAHGLFAFLEAGVHGGHAHEDGHDDEVELEQAWIAVQLGPVEVLPGRRFVPAGLRNATHGVDAGFPQASLAYRAFLGGNYRDDGVEVRLRQQDHWALGTAFWRATGNDAYHVHLDAYSRLAGGYLQARLALLQTRSTGDAPDGHAHGSVTPLRFAGDVRTGVASLQWHAADPQTGILLEVFERHEQGTLHDDILAARYTGHHVGLHAEALWSASPHWRLGLRHAILAANNCLVGPGATPLATSTGLYPDSTHPAETSAILEWQPDTHHGLRLMVMDDDDGNVLLLQYTFRTALRLPES